MSEALSRRWLWFRICFIRWFFYVCTQHEALFNRYLVCVLLFFYLFEIHGSTFCVKVLLWLKSYKDYKQIWCHYYENVSQYNTFNNYENFSHYYDIFDCPIVVELGFHRTANKYQMILGLFEWDLKNIFFIFFLLFMT